MTDASLEALAKLRSPDYFQWYVIPLLAFVIYVYFSEIEKKNIGTIDWLREVQDRGAGEIVLNCMASDGVRQGYDVEQLRKARAHCHVPLIASGGAGTMTHFSAAFTQAQVDGALAASVFHGGIIAIPELKRYLRGQGVEVRA